MTGGCGSKNKPLKVRSLRPDDEGRWTSLFKAYVAFCGDRVANDIIAHAWQRLLHNEDNMFGFVAELPSRSVADGFDIVGLVNAVVHPSTYTTNSYCYLEDLYVDRQARGHGVGRALIEAVYQEADFRECARTYWVTKNDNADARALYERLAKPTKFVQYRR